MKTIAISSPLIVGGGMEGSVMGMDAAGMNTATYFMRDKIYSNKIQAVVREYACNAIDEHNKHDIKQSVQIGLRNNDGSDIEFFVRDFAKGLSESDIRNVFGMYFRSTKSKSNNSIGGFGVGSKAAHCYTDTFFVVSHYEGVKSTYSCMLGGGDTGVPIGHIFEIDSCPTADSGIEVYFSIKKSDEHSFKNQISNFVKYSPSNIAFHQFNNQAVRPLPTLLKKQIGQYSFRLVKDDSKVNVDSSIIQMGGVSYDYIYLEDIRVKNWHCLIIDLPIGSMSIPLSRENFEETASNNKILKEIEDLVIEWNEQDMSQFKNKNLLELIEQKNQNTTLYQGDVFQSNTAKIYKKEWRIAQAISRCLASNPIEMDNRCDAAGNVTQVPILMEIPSVRYWHDKLLKYCKDTGKDFYYITEDRNDASISSNNFKVQNIRKFKFPKQDLNNKSYSVYSNYHKLGNYKAVELNSVAYSRRDVKAPICEKEILEFNTAEVAKAESLGDLYHITISCLKNGQKNHRVGYYTHSKVLIDSMKKLGWLEYCSPEYHAIAEKIIAVEREKNKAANNIRLAKKPWIQYGKRTEKNITNNNKFAEKVNTFWKNVLTENSTRGKVLLMIDNSYVHRNVLSRNEIRQILKLK